jgi:hypothetical protein
MPYIICSSCIIVPVSCKTWMFSLCVSCETSSNHFPHSINNKDFECIIGLPVVLFCLVWAFVVFINQGFVFITDTLYCQKNYTCTCMFLVHLFVAVVHVHCSLLKHNMDDWQNSAPPRVCCRLATFQVSRQHDAMIKCTLVHNLGKVDWSGHSMHNTKPFCW